MAKTTGTRSTPTADTTALAPIDTREDVALANEAGASIQSFIKNLLTFFRTAGELEARASVTLAQSRTLQPATDGRSDEVLQVFVKNCSRDTKQVNEHWEITQIVHAFHKRLVARRKKTTDMLELASSTANRLHVDYVERERRRVAAEQERLRVQAETEARMARQRELDELERQALAVEAESGDLSDRERQFVALHVGGTEAMSAAQQCGYKDPFKASARLLAATKIQSAIRAALDAQQLRRQAADVLEQPLEVREVETLRPDVGTAGHDRTTWSAEVLDERLFVEAVLGGKHGIPADCLCANTVKLNEYARSLRVALNRWPGVRAVSKTRTV